MTASYYFEEPCCDRNLEAKGGTAVAAGTVRGGDVKCGCGRAMGEERYSLPVASKLMSRGRTETRQWELMFA